MANKNSLQHLQIFGRWSKILSFNKKNFRVIKMCFTKFENFCQTKGRLQAKFKFCLKLLHYVWEMVKNLFFHQNNDFQLIKTCLATNFTQMPRGNHREPQLNQSGPPFGFQPFLKVIFCLEQLQTFGRYGPKPFVSSK